VGTISLLGRNLIAGSPQDLWNINGQSWIATQDNNNITVSLTQGTTVEFEEIVLAPNAAGNNLRWGTNNIVITSPPFLDPSKPTVQDLSLTLNPIAPSVNQITTTPSLPVVGQSYTIDLKGSFSNMAKIVLKDLAGDYSVNVPTAYTPQEMLLTVTAHDVTAAGVVRGLVVEPGGSVSNPFSFNVYNPAPTLTSVTQVVNPGGDSFTFTLTGTNFDPQSSVSWTADGNTFNQVTAEKVHHLSATSLQVTLDTSDLLTSGGLTSGIAFQVANPGPSLAASALVDVSLGLPGLSIANLNPVSFTAGSKGNTLHIDGSGFSDFDQVLWNGTVLPGTVQLLDDGELSIPIPDSNLATVGTANISVRDQIDGDTSNAVPLTINDPALALTGISPSTVVVGDPGWLGTSPVDWITVNGSNFQNANTNTGQLMSQVYMDGQPVQTGFLSSTQLAGVLGTSVDTVAGVHAITVQTTQLNGTVTTEGPITFTVPNPQPTFDYYPGNEPPPLVGGEDATVTVTDTNLAAAANGAAPSQFVAGAMLTVGGQPCVTTFISATELQAVIPGSLIPVPVYAPTTGLQNATLPFSVVNPGPNVGAGTSEFQVVAPVPTIASLSPDTVAAGSSDVQVAIAGSGFYDGATQVFLDYVAGLPIGAQQPFPLAVTVASATLLTATVPASELSLGGSHTITVVNNYSDGGPASDPATFTVTNPEPEITGMSRNFAAEDSDPDHLGVPSKMLLTLTGTGFGGWTSVAWTGPDPNATVAIDSYTNTQLVMEVSSALTTPGDATIQVTNAGPGGGDANPVSFVITNPLPTITSIFPNNDAGEAGYDNFSWFAGSTDTSFLVNGTGFFPGATVQWNGQDRATTFVSSTQVNVVFTAADFVALGTAQVGIHNGDGQDSAGTQTFNINAATPTLSSITPSSAAPGSGDVQITLTGNFFFATSEVRWNDTVKLATTYVNGQTLTATLSAQYLAQAGQGNLSVYNPDYSIYYLPSQELVFNVQNPPPPAPSIASLAPSSIPAGSVASSSFLTLTVTGQNFLSNDTIYVTQVGDPTLEYFSLVTFFDSTTQLRGLLYGSYFPTAGTMQVYVKHETGGGSSAILPVTITVPDAGGDFAFSAGTYQAADNSGSATITVDRTGATTNAVNVSYATSDGTAAAGTNYSSVSGTLAFAAGQTQKTFTVPILDQQLYKNDETLNLTLSDATNGAGLAFPSTAVLTIGNTAPAPILSFKSTTGSGPESQNANLLVTLSGATALPGSMTYTIAGTAIAGTDYVLPAVTTLTFEPGDSSLSLPITLLDDGTAHANRTLQVTLSNPTNATLGPNQTTTYTIIDNNPLPDVAFAKTGGSGPEPTKAKLAVMLSAKSAFPVTVNYAVTGGTATAGVDFKLAPGTLTFLPGKTTGTITLPILDDKLYEPNVETIVVTLSSPGNAVLGSAAVFTFTITETDPLPTVSFKLSKSSGKESQTPNLLVVLSGGSSLITTVSYAVIGGTAVAGTDYTLPVVTTLTFQPGQTSLAIPLTLINDGTVHTNRTLKLQLASPTNAGLGKNKIEVFTIIDDNPK